MAKLDLQYLEELLIVCSGRNLAMVECGDGEDRVKLVFHQEDPEVPEALPVADTSEPEDDSSYAAQLLGDDTPKFNREA